MLRSAGSQGEPLPGRGRVDFDTIPRAQGPYRSIRRLRSLSNTSVVYIRINMVDARCYWIGPQEACAPIIVLC